MAIAVGLAFLLSACGDDSSSSASDLSGPESSSVESSSDDEGVSSSSSTKKAPNSSAMLSSSVKSSSSVESSGGDGEWNVSKVYKTVEICNEDKSLCQTWMAENLNFKSAKSYCYDDVEENCAVAGRLYTWAAAIDSAALANDADNPQECGYGKKCSLPTVVQGICPSGWHLPGNKDWYDLLDATGGSFKTGSELKSASGWYDEGNGGDAFGFSALPAGYRNANNGGSYSKVSYVARFWSAEQYESLSEYAYEIRLDSSYRGSVEKGYKNYGLSVRCLKNSDDNAKSSSSAASSSSAKSSSSVDNGKSGWSWDVPKEDRLNPEIEYGEMTDTRDGQVYKTVTIGDGANAQTWMAENLNYADSINTVSLKGKSWCYVNKDENCAVAGRLYTWAAAIDSVALANDADNPQECGYGKKCSLPTVVQGICLSGWHLPSYDDWMALFTAVGGQDKAGSALKSLTGWESFDGVPAGNDAYGFSVLPAGNGANGTSFDDAGKASNFWSASQGEGAGYGANGMVLYYDKELADLDYLSKFYAYSIRCLKD